MEGYNQRQDIFNLVIDEEAKGQLLETARWTKFIAIIGFVLLGLLILVGIAFGMGMSMLGSMTELNDTPGFGRGLGIGMMFVYLLMALLYFFPVYYLFKYSTLIKPSILHGNQEQFNLALSYQKRMFKFMGVIMIIILALYGLFFVIFALSAAFAG